MKHGLWIYKGMLLAAPVIWGLSFVLMKDAVAVLEPATLIGVRFALAAIILSLVFWRQWRPNLDRGTLLSGLALGVLFFLAYWTQTIGLDFTTPGKNAFLTATYCAIVPFIYWIVASVKPRGTQIVAAIICVIGVGFVSLSNEAFTIEFGDVMTLVCAVFFALHIVYVTKFSEKYNVLAMTVYQFWIGGALGLVIGLATEPLPPIEALTAPFFWNLGFLVVFATCVALVFQNVALKHVPPSQASLFLSLESVFGVLFSVLFYGEVLTPSLVLGFVLIFGAILLSEVFTPAREEPKDEGAILLGDSAALSEMESVQVTLEERSNSEGKTVKL